MSKLRSLIFPPNLIPSYSSPYKQMATPFYQLPKSQNSLCLFLLLLMFNPSASAISSTRQCVDAGLYWLARANWGIVRNPGDPVAILLVAWNQPCQGYLHHRNQTHTPPEPVVKPLPAHHWVYLPSMSKVGSLLTTFTLPPWLQTWDYCNRLGKPLYASLFAPLHSILNSGARMILSLQWLPISFRVKTEAPALWLPPPHSSYLSDL